MLGRNGVFFASKAQTRKLNQMTSGTAALKLMRQNLTVMKQSASWRYRHNLKMQIEELLALLEIIEKEITNG